MAFQRYFANSEYYQDGGPIFIYVGGDFPVGTFWLEHGHMHDIAKDLNGYIFGTETRYFGQNRPRSDVTTENLMFLSIEQILADMAHLIDHIRQEDPRLINAKVILVGTMFGGNLATWFRVKYPHYVDGVWSSSSYVEARFNFREYFETIGEDLMMFGSGECYSRIWRAFRTMENLVRVGQAPLLDDMFNLCHPLDASSDLEVQRFFEALAETISEAVINGAYSYVQDMCQHVTDETITNDLIAFSEWFRIEHRPTGCFEMTFQEVVNFLSDTEWISFGVISGRRQYNYLLCTELGWFTTTDSANQPFGTRIRINYFTEMCRQVFGDWITADVIRRNTERTNNSFGGNRPEITNAFFTNGGMDPHRLINVQESLGETVEAQTLPRELRQVFIFPFSMVIIHA